MASLSTQQNGPVGQEDTDTAREEVHDHNDDATQESFYCLRRDLTFCIYIHVQCIPVQLLGLGPTRYCMHVYS